MTEPPIRFDDVWKSYPLGGKRVAVGGVLRAFLGRPNTDGVWALRDVSFQVERGASLGIIGGNGAGKTTILRLLAGISSPSRGVVRTQGRVASLIALGAGFHRELTGRENIYLNGSILGLSHREIDAKFDEIVAFSGLEHALDSPLKQYSSGMTARLGFSVATHVDPDVLLVDEILSVGDAAFRHQSYQRMISFRERGCPFVFVSHDLAAVSVLCDRVLWLDKGVPRLMGSAEEVIRAYLDDGDRARLNEVQPIDSSETGSVVVDRVTFHGGDGIETQEFDNGEPFTVRLHYRAKETVERPLFATTIWGEKGPLFSANMAVDGQFPERLPAGTGIVEAQFDHVPLTAGVYRVAVLAKTDIHHDAFSSRILGSFRIRSDPKRLGFGHPAADSIVRINTLVRVPYQWQVNPGVARPTVKRHRPLSISRNLAPPPAE